MTQSLNPKLFAAAFIAASAASFFSMGTAEASMSSQLKHCKTNSRSATVSCCQAIVGQNLPYWMRESGRNCSTVVSCVGTKKTDSPAVAIAYVAPKKKSYCFVDFQPNNKSGGNNGAPPKQEKEPEFKGKE